jgi:hypothetical protein
MMTRIVISTASMQESDGSFRKVIVREKVRKNVKNTIKQLVQSLIAMSFMAIVLPVSLASNDYIEPGDFLASVFSGNLPESNTVWLSGEKKEIAEKILGHKPDFLRARYWGDNSRSAWILDEIGKTEPITIGIVINDNQIEDIQVLAFRESRGWEIKHDFFTRQFMGARIIETQQLSKSIDGISGATLSVRAMTNVSRLVLFLSASLNT